MRERRPDSSGCLFKKANSFYLLNHKSALWPRGQVKDCKSFYTGSHRRECQKYSEIIMRYSSLLVFVLVCTGTLAQVKQSETVHQTWFGYFNQTRFSNKWGVWTDMHLRTKEDFVSDFSQSILRLGLTYYLNDDTKLTAGYAYVSHYPAENHKNVTMPEHRAWQQLQWHSRYPKLRMMQWLRLEERFRRKILNHDTLAAGYNFNYRARYNFFLMFPLNKKRFQSQTLSLVLNEEVHINFGKQVVYNYFDQNRVFLGLAYHVNRHDNLQFGYMNVFQQLTAGNRYRILHAARIFYFHNLDLRRNIN